MYCIKTMRTCLWAAPNNGNKKGTSGCLCLQGTGNKLSQLSLQKMFIAYCFLRFCIVVQKRMFLLVKNKRRCFGKHEFEIILHRDP